MKLTKEFKEAVYEVVGRIPQGRLMTYGDVAVAAGYPGAAWEVGQVAHWAPCANFSNCLSAGWSDLSVVQGSNEKRSAAYRQYGKRASQLLTRQSAKSGDRVDGSADKQVTAVCPACDLPWQRVVNKQGGLARGYTHGGLEGHKQHLEAEGVRVSEDYTVDIDKLIWFPNAAV